MLWSSHAAADAEQVALFWPHILLAIFSVSTMASLLTLCISTHCCRDAKNKEAENPYGEIGAPGVSAADGSASAVVSRSKADGSRHHHSNRLSCPNLDRHHRAAHRLSVPVPQSSSAINRALPKLPQSSGHLENESTGGAVYSTIDRTVPLTERDGSFLYSEGPANPTYECIDVESDSFSDPLYSKVENGAPSVKRYDYPVFTPIIRPSVSAAADDVFYQSASQIYAGVSEDPYSSITSQAGGEANYDVGYSNVRELAVTEPSGSRLNEPAGNENLEQLYTQIRRRPSSTSRPTKASPPRPVPSSEFVDYASSGSAKTSREPSYRYITVRESVDAIRQRLSEHNGGTNAAISQTSTIENRPIREHYYSSIGGGSDYETLQVPSTSVNQSFYENRDPSTSFVSQGLLFETANSPFIGVDGKIPKPPTSPIPVRSTAQEEESVVLQCTLPSSSGATYLDKAVDSNDNYSSASEKIRKLRTNFFDTESKLLKNLGKSSSINLRFKQPPRIVTQGEVVQELPFQSGEAAGFTDQKADTVLNANQALVGRSTQNSTAWSVSVHEARDPFRSASFSNSRPSLRGNEDIHFHQKKFTKDSRSHSFQCPVILGSKQPGPNGSADTGAFISNSSQLGSWQPWNSAKLLDTIHNKKQSFLERHGSDFSQPPLHSSLNIAESDSGVKQQQPFPLPRSASELLCNGMEIVPGAEISRSMQIACLSFSCESVGENCRFKVQQDADNHRKAEIPDIDRSWPLISSGRSVFSYVNNADNQFSGTKSCNQLKN